MRVLVSGNQGYLGYHVIQQLLNNGHEVVGLDTNLYENCIFGFNSKISENLTKIETLKVDLRDINSENVSGFDSCIHLAGLSNDPLGNLDPDLTSAINHKASVRLAKLCKDNGTKQFIAASSCSIYGASKNELLDENSVVGPITPYAMSKMNMETDLLELSDSNFCVTFLRGGTVYGISPRLRFDLVVNNLVAWACSEGEILLKSDGSAWRPLVHVEDFASVFCAMIDMPHSEINREAFNVAPEGENFRISEIAKTIEHLLPNTQIKFQIEASADNRNYRVSGKKLDNILGTNWNSNKLDQGIVQLAAWIKQFGITTKDFEGSKYQRLGHLKNRILVGELSNDLRLLDRDKK